MDTGGEVVISQKNKKQTQKDKYSPPNLVLVESISFGGPACGYVLVDVVKVVAAGAILPKEQPPGINGNPSRMLFR